MSTQVTLPTFLDRHRVLDVKQTAELLGFSVCHLRRLYRAKKIPAPIQLGARKLGWQAGVVMDLANNASRNTHEAVAR